MYQEKFFALVKEIESLDSRVDDWNTWAKGEVAKDHPEILQVEDTRARANLRASLISELLKIQPRYKTLTGSLNKAMTMAQVYGLAALWETINEDEPAARHEDPAGRGDDHQPGPTVRSQHRDQAA